MKKVILLCFIILLVITGCSKVTYSNEFTGIPIYPGTELMLDSEFDNKVHEMYADMTFKGDIDKVEEYFLKNIDTSIWTIKKVDESRTGHNVDKIYDYTLKGNNRNATLTIAYSDNEKTGRRISITIIGDKLKK